MFVLLGMSLCGTGGLAWLLSGNAAPGIDTYPLILLFGFLSGCGVASFSVAMPQAAYWFPKERQGRVLGICAGIGNLAPGLLARLTVVPANSTGSRLATGVMAPVLPICTSIEFNRVTASYFSHLYAASHRGLLDRAPICSR